MTEVNGDSLVWDNNVTLTNTDTEESVNRRVLREGIDNIPVESLLTNKAFFDYCLKRRGGKRLPNGLPEVWNADVANFWIDGTVVTTQV